MKARDVREFSRELLAAEHSGCRAVRSLCREALEAWGSDWVVLAALADLFLDSADRARCHRNEDLSAAYCLMCQETFDYARDHLDRNAFHRFCEANDYQFI